MNHPKLLNRLAFCFVIASPMQASAADASAWQLSEVPRFNMAGLARPMAPESLQRLFDEAESAYRAKRLPQAADVFQGLIELEPQAAAAWFRLGNIWQSQGQSQWAIFAYKQAAQAEAVALPAQPEDVRQKALLNLAALHLQGSRAALDLIQAEIAQTGKLVAVTSAVADQVEAQGSEATALKQKLINRALSKQTNEKQANEKVKPAVVKRTAGIVKTNQIALQTSKATAEPAQTVQVFSGLSK